MDKGQFYKDAQTGLLQAKSLEDFIQTTQKIQGDQTIFQLLTSLYTCTEDLHKDTISIKLMPVYANPQLIPIETVGDGNCLFRSLSLVHFGNEDNHRKPRVRTVVELSSSAHVLLCSPSA